MISRDVRSGWCTLVCVCTLAAAILASPSFVAAQVMAVPSEGRPTPEQRRAMAEAQRAQANGQPTSPNAEEKTDEKPSEDKKDDEEKKEEDEQQKSLQRPETPPRAPDPREFEVELDERGRVPPFNFIGQPWPDVLQWLANVSGSSLDWQELPSDYLNLTTQRSYTLDELRDLVNRHLHARGYTMLQAGEVLSVFRIANLDPSLVPRVSEEDLYDLKPYDFVKVSFELPQAMDVEKAKEDVAQVLGPSAKVFPLVTTRRLLVLDAVANLRTVSMLLNEERSVQDGRIVPREFVLRHARADQVIDALYVILGMDPKSRPTQVELQVQQKRLELMTQMQQKGTDVSHMLQRDGPPVHLAYNRQRNSVLVNAPPAEMRVIAQAIDYLDVPYGDGDTVAEVERTSSERVMKRYPLTTLDPQTFVLTLEEIGGLSPHSQFEVDATSKMLFALATEADHERIASLIDQFDGSGRQFEVIWLRRLPADAVATTIFNLMVGQEEEKEEDNRPYWMYGGRRRDSEEKKPPQGFRVDADIENNRLLLWANEAELERVETFLVKLGEIPGGQSDPRPVRFVQPGEGAVTAELLEQLRDAWSATGHNELIIRMPEGEAAGPDRESGDTPADEEPADAATDRAADRSLRTAIKAQLAQLERPAEELAAEVAEDADGAAESAVEESPTAQDADATDGQPPVTITVTEDGRLMISSPDTAALDELEDLLGQLAPPERRYRVFRLQHTTALNMKWVLEDFFADELQGGAAEYMLDWFGRRQQVTPREEPTTLSRRRRLMITHDTPSNTILVANASPRQLREIEELIDEYDQPAPADSVKTRRTAAIPIRYSRAQTIADALKEVYRDLLSSRDREFDNLDQRERGRTQERTTIIRYGDSSSDSASQRPSPVQVGFEGALSIGVDEIANILIVSVQEELFDNVVAMVKQLDESAAPNTTVRVHQVSGGVPAAALQKAMSEALTTPWVGGRPEHQATDEEPQDRGRDRQRSRRGESRGQ